MGKLEEDRCFSNGILIGFVLMIMLVIVPMIISWNINANNNWKDGYTAGQADVLGGNAPVIVEHVRQADGTEQWEVVEPFPTWVRRNYKQQPKARRGY